jgi:colanic acid biosynthesis glycosyl transferase WcaI
MRLLVVSVNYAPEMTGFARHVSRLSEYFVRKGDEVTVVTAFPFAPRWKRWPEYDGMWVRRERTAGVDVIRVTHFVPRRPSSTWQRLLMEVTFCAAAAWQLFRLHRRFDAILYVGAQPAVAMLTRIASALGRIPYIVWINDLAAEAARDVGIIRSRVLVRLFRWFEYSAYSKAAGAIVLCEAFCRALVDHGFPAGRVRVIGSPIDVDHIRPVIGRGSRRDFGIPDDAFVVLYAGSMGLKQGMSNVIEAATIARQRDEKILWVLVGEGEERDATKRRVVAAGLEDVVQLLPLQPEEDLPQVFAMADVLLLNQLSTVKDTVVPSKLLTYMAAGKPVVAAVNGTSEAAALIQQSRGGVLVAPEDPAALAAAVVALSDPAREQERSAMAARSRQFAVERFDEKKVFSAQREFLRDIVEVSRRKLRLLFVNHNVVRSGGTFYRAFDVARFLVRRGHSVTLLSISASSRLRSEREMAEGVEIIHTPDLFWGIGRSGWDPWDTLVRMKLSAETRWDLIHAWDSRPAVILPALTARRFSKSRGAKLVIDWSDWWGRGGTQMERGGGWTRYLYNAVETFFEERFRRFADATTVISNALRHRAETIGVQADRILLLPQGCDRAVVPSLLSRAAARAVLGVPSGVPLFITIGILNVSDAKFLFETIRHMIRRHSSVRFALIGRTRSKVPPDLLSSMVQEVGYVSDEILTHYIAAADALLVPLADNVSSRARWPSRVNLCLGRGLPVVITRVGDLPQMLEREGAAFVTKPDPAEFAERALQAVADPQLAAQVRSAGRRVAADMLPWDSIISDLETFYYSVMGAETAGERPESRPASAVYS